MLLLWTVTEHGQQEIRVVLEGKSMGAVVFRPVFALTHYQAFQMCILVRKEVWHYKANAEENTFKPSDNYRQQDFTD